MRIGTISVSVTPNRWPNSAIISLTPQKVIPVQPVDKILVLNR
jgi:hypothetical protein